MVTIQVGQGPEGIAVNEITNTIYVVNAGGTVSVIDGDTNTVIDTIFGIELGSEEIAVNETTNRIYVANTTKDTVTVIDGNTNNIIGLPIPVGNRPFGFAINETTNIAYVCNEFGNTVLLIDGTNQIIPPTIFVEGPGKIVRNQSTNLLYTVNAFDEIVRVIDGDTNTVIGLPIQVGLLPRNLAVNETTNRIYVTNSGIGDNTVSVIDGNTDTVIGLPIPVGNRPRGITINDSTNIIYIANQIDNSVSVIDGNTNTVIDTIPVGNGPLGITINETTNIVYVTNADAGTVTVITGQNKIEGLAQGPIDHKASSIINSVCGDSDLKIGAVVKLLPVGTGNGFTQPEDLLPRVGAASLGESAYGIVVGGDFEGVYGDQLFEAGSLSLGIIVSFFGDGVRVCTQGRCLALVTGAISIGAKLTPSLNDLISNTSGEIIATALQSTSPNEKSIIAVDVQREGFF